MPSLENSLKKFHNLDPEAILTIDSDKTAKKMEEAEKKFNLEAGVLGALLIFMSTGDLDDKGAVLYLKERLEIKDAPAMEIYKYLEQNILNPLKKRLDFLNANPKKEMSLSVEKEIVLDIFLRGLIDETREHPLIINSVNIRIFYILQKEFDFKGEIFKAMSINQERLTDKPFLLENKKMAPTIGNWVSCFIKEKGGSLFNNLILSDFLINSRNAKILDEKEKDILKKILIIYRNIKFFPASMPNDTGENWEIIPLEIQAGQDETPRKVSSPKQITEDEKKVIIEEKKVKTEKEIKLAELELSLAKYPEDSLERMAIKEEIKQLKKEK